MSKKTAVITGASRGIGRAIAFELGKQGFELICSSRSEKKLAELHKSLSEAGYKCTTYSCDVSDKASLSDFATQIQGPVDVLVNNAGVFHPGALMEEDEGVLESTIQTNLYSAYYLTRALIDGMKAQKSGHIINICSVASLTAYPNGGSYSISKFALLGFSKNLRLELQEEGIRVTAVMPGAVYTDSWEGTDLPETRFMSAEDIASAVGNAVALSSRTVLEDIILRPQLGDI
ncbi:MAG: short-subunit dehydrogenase [Limisphaerales bacterium]|jgi:short-subunit dehydrogenase